VGIVIWNIGFISLLHLIAIVAMIYTIHKEIYKNLNEGVKI